MASSVIYYTAPDHYRMIVNSTSEAAATGTDKQYMVDSNLDTIFQPVNANNQDIFIDTYPQDSDAYAAGRGKTSGSHEAICIWLNNYDTDFSSTDVFFSSLANVDDSGSSEPKSWTHLGGPLWFVDLDTPLIYRYIRINMPNLPAVPKIGQIMALKKYTLNRPNQYPVEDLPEYLNNTRVTPAGVKHTYRSSKNPVIHFMRNYSLFFPADHTMVENIFNDCEGEVNPFIIQEGTVVTDAYMCKMDMDEGKWQDVSYQFRTNQFIFTSLPYIRDGENY